MSDTTARKVAHLVAAAKLEQLAGSTPDLAYTGALLPPAPLWPPYEFGQARAAFSCRTVSMHIWILLVVREVALLGILLVLGSGPAAFLPQRVDPGSRIALAPLLGFCLGTCVTTTLLEFFPVNSTYWVLIPLGLLSLAVAVVRMRRSASRPWPSVKDLAALALVVVVVVGPVDAVLHEHRTVGPAAYFFTDVDNYVSRAGRRPDGVAALGRRDVPPRPADRNRGGRPHPVHLGLLRAIRIQPRCHAPGLQRQRAPRPGSHRHLRAVPDRLTAHGRARGVRRRSALRPILDHGRRPGRVSVRRRHVHGAVVRQLSGGDHRDRSCRSLCRTRRSGPARTAAGRAGPGRHWSWRPC